ncbi:hypothetical protein [Acinetobacter sp. ANC 4648]|uniref:hypothetical protein n=1 Tax=Acinetobacter sp. ANC 4648 TaxID=1977875 RepID=UPI000A34A01B|nr:hypothetical protein [Acinetobacter sp. ANC 4648]OTG79401.1 hypothetical protein B9T27_14485 [Acinetobacter sp. ANC 4648]
MLITPATPKGFALVSKDLITVIIYFHVPFFTVLGGFILYMSTLSASAFTAFLAFMGLGLGMWFGFATMLGIAGAIDYLFKKLLG